MSKRAAHKDDRLFVRDGRRSYRKRYSMNEFRIGLVVLAGLALAGAWVIWRGARPDPALFEIPAELLDGQMAPAESGPLPVSLAAPGWSSGTPSQFDADNLYEKINGREDYYKSFGFERLHFVSIVRDDDEATVVDVELFDLGDAANALGAYSGERPPDATPTVDERGMSHLAPNALFMTRGRFYLRAIGSDTTAVVRTQLEHLRRTFESGLDDEPLPWAYTLFVGQLGLDAGRVSYLRENAFSFGFARNVYTATLPDDQTEVFVVAVAGEDTALGLAQRFTQGFLQYGSLFESTEKGSGVQWVRDRYLNAISGATASSSWVTGVRGAPTVATAEAALISLHHAVQSLPVEAAERARASAKLSQTLAKPGYPDEN